MIILELIFFFYGLCYLSQGLAHVYTFAKSLFFRNQVQKYSKSWALVTACTEGIGLGFVHRLAELGFNIVQVGRNPEKLKIREKELREKYKIEVVNIVKDFSSCHQNCEFFFTEIFQKIEDLDVSLLVNNVGTTEIGGFLSNLSWIINQNSLNLFPAVFMTKLFLQKVRNRKLGAGVINMSSLTSEFSTPFVTTYSAGKSFIKVFTSIVQEECGADVLCYEPGYVSTPLGEKFGFTFVAISCFTCANIGVRALGNTAVFVGHWTHYLCFFLYWVMHVFFGVLAFAIKRVVKVR